jgi:hypothetical protein
MNMTILQRIHSLATVTPSDNVATLASVARYVTSDKSDAAKAHGITSVLRKLSEADQVRILSAVESLLAPSGGEAQAPGE